MADFMSHLAVRIAIGAPSLWCSSWAHQHDARIGHHTAKAHAASRADAIHRYRRYHVHALIAARFERHSPLLRVMASEVAAGSAGLQVSVLGILAVAGVYTTGLSLIALLIAGTAIVLTGGSLSGSMTCLMSI
jgi:hypothetical protein